MGQPLLRFGLSALIVIAGLTGLSSRSVSAQSAVGPGAAPPAGRLAGIDFLTLNNPIARFGPDFQRIRADGANTVSFDVWQVVPSDSSSQVVAVPGKTDSDADLLTATQEARQAGLRVTLTPKLVVGLQGGYTGWRGLYKPPDPAAFFSNYQSMIDHYATLAQQAGMSMLVVGSEMVASDQYVGDWRRVIATARKHFTGPIGYEADWREISQFDFGDAVDVLLLSAYFPISNEERPTLQQLLAGWHAYQPISPANGNYPGPPETHDAFSAVAGLAKRWNKPITFGEAGYTATTYPAELPWLNTANVKADPQEQYLSYQALLETFSGQPWWGGVLWWAWNDDPSVRSPEGKPAESLIGAPVAAVPAHPPTSMTPGTTPGTTQAVNVSVPSPRGPVDSTRGPVDTKSAAATSMHRAITGIALASLVVALLTTVLLGGWLQSSGRRRRSEAGRLARTEHSALLERGDEASTRVSQRVLAGKR
jgi:hypothetical protein